MGDTWFTMSHKERGNLIRGHRSTCSVEQMMELWNLSREEIERVLRGDDSNLFDSNIFKRPSPKPGEKR